MNGTVNDMIRGLNFDLMAKLMKMESAIGRITR